MKNFTLGSLLVCKKDITPIIKADKEKTQLSHNDLQTIKLELLGQ